MKHLWVLALGLLLTACGAEETTFKGTFTCEECIYQELEFKPDGNAMLKVEELNIPATYTKEGNTIAIEIETGTYTFTLMPDGNLQGKGDVLGTYTQKNL